MPEAHFHFESEPDPAVNRIDFYGLFSSLACSHGCKYFGLAELPDNNSGFNLQGVHSLHNFPDDWFETGACSVIEQGDPTVKHLLKSSAPSSLDLSGTSSAMIGARGHYPWPVRAND